jgi:hypothetical protein
VTIHFWHTTRSRPTAVDREGPLGAAAAGHVEGMAAEANAARRLASASTLVMGQAHPGRPLASLARARGPRQPSVNSYSFEEGCIGCQIGTVSWVKKEMEVAVADVVIRDVKRSEGYSPWIR